MGVALLAGPSLQDTSPHQVPSAGKGEGFFLFFITLKPRVECFAKCVSLKYDQATRMI